jgi:hypothetical protein
MEIIGFGLVVGVIVGGAWFLVWAIGGGARKQGDAVKERAERRRREAEAARDRG